MTINPRRCEAPRPGARWLAARAVLLLTLLLAGVGCSVAQQNTLPAAFTTLPNFRSWMIPDPEFGGEAFMFEAGPREGTTVLLLHGVGNDGVSEHLAVLPALAQRHHLIGFDLPGFGRSTHANLFYSPRRYVRFLEQAIRPRISAPFDLVGHSLGATLALMYAGQHPADVRRLAVIDAAAILHRDSYTEFEVHAGLDRMPQAFRPSVELARTMASMIAEPLVDAAPDFKVVLSSDFARSALLNSPGRVAALAFMTEDFGPWIERIQAPSLIVWGSDDKIAPLRTAQLLRVRLPGARLAVIDGAGHEPIKSHPELVARLVNEHLDAIRPERAPEDPLALAGTSPHNSGRCEGRDDVRFEGAYSDISITRCRNVRLSRVQASRVSIRDSDVVIDQSVVTARGTAVTIHDSRVQMTGTDITADVAVEVNHGDLDLAGVRLRGEYAAMHAHGSTRVTFSVSRIFSPRANGHVHGTRHLRAGAEL